MARTTSKQRPWVVVCSRNGSTPQVIGAFLSRNGAQGWIDTHWERYPLWAFSTAKLGATPTAPIPWERTNLKRVPGEEARGHWWQFFGRRRREDREQAEREPAEVE